MKLSTTQILLKNLTSTASTNTLLESSPSLRPSTPGDDDEDGHASKPGGLPALKQVSMVIEEGRNGGFHTYGCSTKGLYVHRIPVICDGVTYMVVRLKRIPLRSSGNAF